RLAASEARACSGSELGKVKRGQEKGLRTLILPGNRENRRSADRFLTKIGLNNSRLSKVGRARGQDRNREQFGHNREIGLQRRTGRIRRLEAEIRLPQRRRSKGGKPIPS